MKKLEMFLMDWRNALAFGWWMNDQQTEDEIEKGATIEKNNRGWDKPDGYRFTLWLEALRRRDDISMEEVQEAVDELRSSLEKYFRQWQEFYGDPYWTRNLPAWTKELPEKRQREHRIVVMRNLDDDRYVKAIDGGYAELTGNRKEAMYLREDEASKIVDGSDRLWLQFTSGPKTREDRKRAQEERRKIEEQKIAEEHERQFKLRNDYIDRERRLAQAYSENQRKKSENLESLKKLIWSMHGMHPYKAALEVHMKTGIDFTGEEIAKIFNELDR